MHKLLTFISFAAVTASCLAQTSLSQNQQASNASNIGSTSLAKVPSVEAVAPYEVTLDDLVNTPWGESDTLDTYFGWKKRGSFGVSLFYTQGVAPLFINLERGQDLILHVADSYSTSDDQYMNAGAVFFDSLFVVDWKGWDAFLQGWRPLEYDAPFVTSSGLEGTTVDYHFKNQHAGKVSLRFLYCLSGNHSKGSSRFNVQDVIVTVK